MLLQEAHPGAIADAKVKETFDRLREELVLALPDGKQPTADEYARSTLTRRVEYDAREFQKHLNAVANVIQKK